MKDILFRILNTEDANSYKKIRLELLEENPTAFGSSFEEESAFDDFVWLTRISKSTVDTIGAFFNDELIGIAVLSLNPRKKIKHIASIHSIYVTKNMRRKGLGRKLIEYTFNVALSHGVERINLSVVSVNKRAIALYKSLGFEVYGEEKGTIKYNDMYYNLTLMTKLLKIDTTK